MGEPIHDPGAAVRTLPTAGLPPLSILIVGGTSDMAGACPIAVVEGLRRTALPTLETPVMATEMNRPESFDVKV